MSRIERAFENRFRQLLTEFGAREREKGVRLLFEKAGASVSNGSMTLSQALARENILLATRKHRFRPGPGNPPPRVICDAGLGGLARWLRASGCEAIWIRDITDWELVDAAIRLNAVIATTDSLLLDRRQIKNGEVTAYWVPPSLTKFEQLRLLLAELNLPEADSRCMKCGGELVEIAKEAARERIPPKTYRWIDQYFECAHCGKLFWHGSHWTKIQEKLLARSGAANLQGGDRALAVPDNHSE